MPIRRIVRRVENRLLKKAIVHWFDRVCRADLLLSAGQSCQATVTCEASYQSLGGHREPVPCPAALTAPGPLDTSSYCFFRLSDAVFACGPISRLRDVMSAVPVRDAPATVP